jgi:hypothetical protein
LHLR